jgi:hypothetical protein
VREENVAFGLFAVIDHDVDHVAGFDGYFALVILKLVEGNEAFGFIAEVDDDVFGVDREDDALDNFVGGWRGKMRVVVEQKLVVFG